MHSVDIMILAIGIGSMAFFVLECLFLFCDHPDGFLLKSFLILTMILCFSFVMTRCFLPRTLNLIDW